MFHGINLCGAESNTKLPEQHRVHPSHAYCNKLYAISALLSSQTLEADTYDLDDYPH